MDLNTGSLKFIVLCPDTWDDIVHIARRLTGFVFRGQMDSTWNLTTSIERLTHDFCNNSTFLQNRELWILKQFQRRAHNYIPNPPSDIDFMEWLALIQHHGGPTRLLDFTHSFYNAVFFATEMAQTDSALWAVNTWKMNINAQKNVGEMSVKETIHHINLRYVEFANKCLYKEENIKLVLNLEPDRMNERLAAQQGLFLFPCDITVSFEENLAQTFGSSLIDFSSVKPKTYDRKERNFDRNDFDIVKIIITRNLHAKIIEDLDKMNINAASLFPGLDGFARSLRKHLRSLEPDCFV